MTNQAPQPVLVGTISPDQHEVLLSGETYGRAAKEILEGIGSSALSNEYALIVTEDEAGQAIPKGYASLSRTDLGTLIQAKNYDAKGLPALDQARAVIAERDAKRVEDHVAGGTPVFGDKSGSAGSRDMSPKRPQLSEGAIIRQRVTQQMSVSAAAHKNREAAGLPPRSPLNDIF